MNAKSVRIKTRTRAAFTVWDLLIVISTVALLVTFITLLQYRPRRTFRCGVQCISNHKQVALATRMWANDNEEAYPMSVPAAKGGSMESATTGDPIPTFLALSNELNRPIILYCPQDTKRGPRARTFDELCRTNTSYSIGIDASETNSSAILVADRNIILPHVAEPEGLLNITNWRHAVWSREIHQFKGHIALADGSALQVDQRGLQKALQNSGLGTNRFAVP